MISLWILIARQVFQPAFFCFSLPRLGKMTVVAYLGGPMNQTPLESHTVDIKEGSSEVILHQVFQKDLGSDSDQY